MVNDDLNIPTIAIVGAGFSGICLAANLYQLSQSPLRVIIIGTPALFGKGLAYSTKNPLHLLNVRAKDMSAFSHDNDHFVNWLHTSSYQQELRLKPTEIKDQFIPRFIYAEYLQDILFSILKLSPSGCKIELIHDEVIAIHESDVHLKLQLQKGQSVAANKAVLAHGHILPKSSFDTDNSIPIIENPWDYQSYKDIPENLSVLILGTGLTMVDAVIQLKSQNHSGKIYALSRRGLIPKLHVMDTAQYIIDETTFPKKLRDIIKYIRQTIEKSADDIAAQQALFKAIRININVIWDGFSSREKKQFLRHCLPYWEVQRHRLPPEVSEIINQLLSNNSVGIIKGRLAEVKNSISSIYLRNQNTPTHFNIDVIINCTGPSKYTLIQLTPLIASLVDQGLVQINDLNLGLTADPSGALIDANNISSSKLFSLGPPLKGILFETTAVREIRSQARKLASLLNID